MEISITFKQPKPEYDCDNAFVDVAITGLRVQQVHRICERMPDVIAHAYSKFMSVIDADMDADTADVEASLYADAMYRKGLYDVNNRCQNQSKI